MCYTLTDEFAHLFLLKWSPPNKASLEWRDEVGAREWKKRERVIELQTGSNGNKLAVVTTKYSSKLVRTLACQILIGVFWSWV